MRLKVGRLQDTNIYLIPIIIFMAVVPLIVYLKVVPLDASLVPYWTGEKSNYDYFSYYKSMWILISAALSLLSILVYICVKKIALRNTLVNKIMALYAFCIIMSSFLAEFKRTAIFGAPDRYEGMLVLLAYLLLCFAIINLLRNARDIKWIMISLFISAALIALLGILQFFGWDLFNTVIGKRLILPTQYHYMTAALHSTLTNNIGSTLYNPNNVGMYMSMLVPLSLSFFLLLKKKSHKIIMGALSGLMFANLLGANSRGGYIGASIAVIVLLVLLKKSIASQWKSVLGISILFVAVFIIMNIYADGRLLERGESILNGGLGQENKIENAWQSTPGNNAEFNGKYQDIAISINQNQLIINANQLPIKIGLLNDKLSLLDPEGKEMQLKKNEKTNLWQPVDPGYSAYSLERDGKVFSVKYEDTMLNFQIVDGFIRFANEISSPITEMTTVEDELTIVSTDTKLKITMKDNIPVCMDQDGKNIALNPWPAGKKYTLNDERFADYFISMTDSIMQIYKGNKMFVFIFGNEGVQFIDPRGKAVDLPVESWGFAGQETMFSSRAYIWSRSIPLLKETLALGHGPDTFFIYFPQYDMVGKWRFLHSSSILVDKPHNLYLQLAINTGVISLLAFLSLVFYYLYSSWRLYRKAVFNSIYEVTGISASVAVIGYLISAFTYDSTVSVAPVFWGILGIGIACNLICKNEPERVV
jgi:O-antigen ligase